jgi:hypothetical protein
MSIHRRRYFHVSAPGRENQRLVIFDLRDAIPRHLLNDSFVALDTLASSASGDYF